MTTWSNKQEGRKFITVKFDRFMANKNWINKYPNFINKHLPIYLLFHNPILLTFDHDYLIGNYN